MAGNLTVFDLADPAAPRPVRTLKGGGDRMRVVGDRVYYWGRTLIGTGIVVGALDLANGLASLGSGLIPDAQAVDVAAGNLAVAVGRAVVVYDVTTPKTPAERFRQSDVIAFGVTTSGSRAWVPATNGLYAVDLTAPTQVAVTGPVDLPTLIHNQSAAEGNQLVVVTDRARLLSIDVSNPAAPVGRAVADVSVCDYAVGVHATERAVYVAANTGGLRTARLPALDQFGGGDPGGRPDFEDLVTAGTTAFVADWFFGLRAYDVADPAAPRSIVEMPMQANPSAIDYEDGRLYLGQATNGGVLWIFDVTTPAKPVQIGMVATPQVHDLKVRNKIVYIAGGSFSGEPGLAIFDATNPAQIAPRGRFACDEALDLALSDSALVLACSNGFHFLDITDPAQPVRRAGLTLPRPHSPTAVAAAGTRAFLGDDTGMTMFDLTDPAAPAMLSKHPTSYPVRALHARTPTHVFAAAGLGGIYQWTFTAAPTPVVTRLPGASAP
jgi:hypothetical protein